MEGLDEHHGLLANLAALFLLTTAAILGGLNRYYLATCLFFTDNLGFFVGASPRLGSSLERINRGAVLFRYGVR